jgi:hypothetical protein
MWPMHAPVLTPLKRASVRPPRCPREVLQGAGHLQRFFHTAAQGSGTDYRQNIARPHRAFSNRLDSRPLADADAGRPGLAVDAVRIEQRGVDGGAFDRRAFRRQISLGQRDRAGQSAFPGPVRWQNHVVRINAVFLLKNLAQTFAPV